MPGPVLAQQAPPQSYVCWPADAPRHDPKPRQQPFPVSGRPAKYKAWPQLGRHVPDPLTQTVGNGPQHPPLASQAREPQSQSGQVLQFSPALQMPSPQNGAHAGVLQLWELEPEHGAPPFDGGGLVQVRVWVPPPHETEHGPQSLQSPLTGHPCVLQLWLLGPEQPAPPLAGAGQLQVRVWVPPPQETEQPLQPHQTPLTGTTHAWVLQLWELGPEHGAPPLAGTGFVQVWVCVPPSQEAEHGPQSLQPPSTGAGPQVPMLYVPLTLVGPPEGVRISLIVPVKL